MLFRSLNLYIEFQSGIRGSGHVAGARSCYGRLPETQRSGINASWHTRPCTQADPEVAINLHSMAISVSF